MRGATKRVVDVLAITKRAGVWLLIALVGFSGILFCIFGNSKSFGSGVVPYNISSSSSSSPALALVDGYENQQGEKLSVDDEPPAGRGQCCPDFLVQQDGKYTLHFANSAVAGWCAEDAIVFQSLSEYRKYQKVQEDNGRTCPAPLFSRKEVDSQGKEVFRFYASPFDVDGGLPAIPVRMPQQQQQQQRQDNNNNNDDDDDGLAAYDYDSPFLAAEQFTGFDAQGQDQGRFDKLDAVHLSTRVPNKNSRKKNKKKCHDNDDDDDDVQPSENPMDPNWGGVSFTAAAVAAGNYAGNDVTRPVQPNFKPK